jgi:nitrogen fixation NifU-like protein
MDDSIYREQIIDLYEHPLNYGQLETADWSYEEDNPLCGDVIRIDVKLDDQNRVAEVAWSGDGCAISQAAASLLTEEIKGMALEDVRNFDKDELLELIGCQAQSWGLAWPASNAPCSFDYEEWSDSQSWGKA